MGWEINLQLPCVELARDEVVLAADLLEGSVATASLTNVHVSVEVLDGHVDRLLWK